ncbi:MAG: discoidin domain-containing protein, partial [Oscillospiraceae bacterium]|nr:discoidin domain-containing protein [Oscillospiraceae bacterium]
MKKMIMRRSGLRRVVALALVLLFLAGLVPLDTLPSAQAAPGGPDLAHIDNQQRHWVSGGIDSANAFNGDTGNWWKTSSHDSVVGVDLGAVHNISQIRVGVPDNSTHVTVQYSSDPTGASGWEVNGFLTEAVDAGSGGGYTSVSHDSLPLASGASYRYILTAGVHNFNIPGGVDTRYVRVIAHWWNSGGGDSDPAISVFEVYAEGGTSSGIGDNVALNKPVWWAGGEAHDSHSPEIQAVVNGNYNQKPSLNETHGSFGIGVDLEQVYTDIEKVVIYSSKGFGGLAGLFVCPDTSGLNYSNSFNSGATSSGNYTRVAGIQDANAWVDVNSTVKKLELPVPPGTAIRSFIVKLNHIQDKDLYEIEAIRGDGTVPITGTVRGIDLARGPVTGASGHPDGHNLTGRPGHRSWSNGNFSDNTSGTLVSYEPHLAFDGLTYCREDWANTRRYWQGNSNPNTGSPNILGVDLGDTYALDEIKIKIPQYSDNAMTSAHPWDARIQNMRIQFATAAGAFGNVAPGDANWTAGEISARDYYFDGTVGGNVVTVKVPLDSSSLRHARYVRLLINSNSELGGAGWGGQIAAFEVYGERITESDSITDIINERTSDRTVTSQASPSGTNVAANKPIWANYSHEGSGSPRMSSLQYLVDGQTAPASNGWWYSAGRADRGISNPDIITIDLRDEYTLRGIGLYSLERLGGPLTLRMRIWASVQNGDINRTSGFVDAPGMTLVRNWANYTFTNDAQHNYRHIVNLTSGSPGLPNARYVYIEVAGKTKGTGSTAIEPGAEGTLHLSEIQVLADTMRTKTAPAAVSGSVEYTIASHSGEKSGRAANNVLSSNNDIWEGSSALPNFLTLDITGGSASVSGIVLKKPAQAASNWVSNANGERGFPKSTQAIEIRDGGDDGTVIKSGTYDFDPYTNGNQVRIDFDSPIDLSRLTVRVTGHTESNANTAISSPGSANGYIYNAENTNAQLSEVIVLPGTAPWTIRYETADGTLVGTNADGGTGIIGTTINSSNSSVQVDAGMSDASRVDYEVVSVGSVTLVASPPGTNTLVVVVQLKQTQWFIQYVDAHNGNEPVGPTAGPFEDKRIGDTVDGSASQIGTGLHPDYQLVSGATITPITLAANPPGPNVLVVPVEKIPTSYTISYRVDMADDTSEKGTSGPHSGFRHGDEVTMAGAGGNVVAPAGYETTGNSIKIDSLGVSGTVLIVEIRGVEVTWKIQFVADISDRDATRIGTEVPAAGIAGRVDDVIYGSNGAIDGNMPENYRRTGNTVYPNPLTLTTVLADNVLFVEIEKIPVTWFIRYVEDLDDTSSYEGESRTFDGKAGDEILSDNGNIGTDVPATYSVVTPHEVSPVPLTLAADSAANILYVKIAKTAVTWDIIYRDINNGNAEVGSVDNIPGVDGESISSAHPAVGTVMPANYQLTSPVNVDPVPLVLVASPTGTQNILYVDVEKVAVTYTISYRVDMADDTSEKGTSGPHSGFRHGDEVTMAGAGGNVVA